MTKTYKYCPNCRNPIKEKENSYECDSCGMKFFKNSSPTACAIIMKGESILFSIRAIDPHKGKYDLPGGFLNYGEHPESGLVREVKEETGLDVEIKDLFGVFMGNYEYQGGKEKTLNFYYFADIAGGKLKAQDDVEKLQWIKLNNIPFGKLGFDYQKGVLKKLKDWYKNSDK